jgi:addiction module HigA family antidote
MLERKVIRAKLITPPHPGETILEDILKPLNMSQNQLAKHLGVTATRLNEIVHGRRGVTADTALRLARYLGTSAILARATA